MGNITVKKILLVAVPVVIVVLTTVFFRGPHISNLLKQLILPNFPQSPGNR